MLAILVDTWKGLKTLVRWSRTFFWWYVDGYRLKPPPKTFGERAHRAWNQVLRVVTTLLLLVAAFPIVIAVAWYTRH